MSGTKKLQNRVRELRARLKLRQADLADAVGVTRQTIIAIEKGRFNPSVLVGIKIARVLREPVDYVFYLAAGAESEPLDTSDLEAAEPKRGRKRKATLPVPSRKTAVVFAEEEAAEGAGEPESDEMAEVPDLAETIASAGTLGIVSCTEPRVEIAAETRPEETALSVAAPQPEIVEPVADESEFDDESLDAAQAPVDSAHEFRDEVSVPEGMPAREESGTSEEIEPQQRPAPGQPKERETETGQAIWDFV